MRSSSTPTRSRSSSVASRLVADSRRATAPLVWGVAIDVPLSRAQPAPGTLDSTLVAVTSAVAVDDSLGNGDLLSMAYSMRGLRPADVQFFTAPVLGTGREGAASVVYLDTNTGARMWGYLQTDSLGENAGEFSAEALPQVPR